MTIPRLVAFTTHWESHPPLAVTVAAIAAALGFEFKSTKYADNDQLVGELAGIPGFAVEVSRG
jgi:hypothetical protein